MVDALVILIMVYALVHLIMVDALVCLMLPITLNVIPRTMVTHIAQTNISIPVIAFASFISVHLKEPKQH